MSAAVTLIEAHKLWNITLTRTPSNSSTYWNEDVPADLRRTLVHPLRGGFRLRGQNRGGRYGTVRMKLFKANALRWAGNPTDRCNIDFPRTRRETLDHNGSGIHLLLGPAGRTYAEVQDRTKSEKMAQQALWSGRFEGEPDSRRLFTSSIRTRLWDSTM